MIRLYPTAKPYPFSDAVESNSFLFLSGKISMEDDGTIVEGTVTEQTNCIMAAAKDQLGKAGLSLADLVKVTVWLSDMSHFTEFNQAYKSWFTGLYPTRNVTGSQLAFNMDVEIEFQAAMHRTKS